ncbi:MAG: DNA repair protein RecO [Bacteroidetes bacterium ADurb.Bin408]|nr:MAG: DNA repair protein RecO [Bacteroidetes bacterium ADurb.Bin408]
MLVSTRGIVLRHFKYNDNSIICKIYTEELGIRSYMVNGVHSKKSSGKLALFQPLTLLDMVVYNNEKLQLQRIKEVVCSEALKQIHPHVVKSSMALFVAEVLLKTIREEEPNVPLFNFTVHFIRELDKRQAGYADMHLIFLMELTRYLGFYPKEETFSEGAWFDMPEGRFVVRQPLHSSRAEPILAALMHRLTQAGYADSGKLGLNGSMRAALLDKLLLYYAIHLEGMGSINTAEVLKMVFSGDN